MGKHSPRRLEKKRAAGHGNPGRRETLPKGKLLPNRVLDSRPCIPNAHPEGTAEDLPVLLPGDEDPGRLAD